MKEDESKSEVNIEENEAADTENELNSDAKDAENVETEGEVRLDSVDEEEKKIIEISNLELKKLQETADKAQANWERYLREKAELDNFRKRSARDQDESRKRANEGLISDLLPVLDNFEAALAAASQSSEMNLDAMKTGVEMILGQMKNLLSDNGLQEVDATGQVFDPALHDALGEEESEDVAEGHVLKQLRKGYKLRDRLIRPASVYVAKKANGEPEQAKINPED